MNNLKNAKEKGCIVHVTTYPPRECGLATFSADLIKYADDFFFDQVETKVVAMKIPNSPTIQYGDKVIGEIIDNDRLSYESMATHLNTMPEVKIVSIQHEFGIFGPNYGENIVYFLEKIQKPVVITFHTVLQNPDQKMKQVVENILKHSQKNVVMTESAKALLIQVYGSKEENIKVIPHGIHPQLYVHSEVVKEKFKLSGKKVLTTFGLLSRGKGIEYGIEALPEIVAKYPDTVYLILGATHPVVFRNEGEVYRNSLIEKIAKLGMEKHVIFYNNYLSTDELLLFLQATDIYISLSQDPNQTVSGTLTYGLGAGRAVISTPFMQAKEMITGDVGVFIPFGDSKSLSEEVIKLFDDPERLLNMGKSAYFKTRNMTWPNVALGYMSVFSTISPDMSEKNKYMLPIKIDHLKELTDDFGILQFATLNKPDPKWGYTLDDNARALVGLCWLNRLQPTLDLEVLINVYLSFIERSSKDTGGFVNYFDVLKNPHDELNKNENLEDSNARALWALSVVDSSNVSQSLKVRAGNLFSKQFVLHKKITSPRAAAFYIKACGEYLQAGGDADILEHLKIYADTLVDLFERSSDGSWHWFEESLTYSNALLPDALLVAYTVTKNEIYLKTAQSALDFLLEQFFEGDLCVPVGQDGWFKKGSKKERYDQQPEEVSALVLALHRMVSIKEDDFYSKKMTLAFDWFLGNNLSHQVVYTHSTGGCYDGIIEGGINLNQGAESTLSYLLARLTLEIENQ
jgi:glycosyltransferase involved in cell wall biosynthesis